MKTVRWLIRFTPTLLMSLLLSVIVWFSAVTSTDPNEEITYAKPIPISILGLNPEQVITGEIADSVTVTIRAPRSIHQRLSNEPGLVQCFINLSGLSAGEHTITPDVSVKIGPSEVTRITPQTINLTIEQMRTVQLPVTLITTGSLPISYEAGQFSLSTESVQVIGPQSLVESVAKVIATIDLTNLTSNISRPIELKAVDKQGSAISGINLNPTNVIVNIPITQLGGYRNVFVKIVTTGQVARGFYLTGILSNPPSITISSTEPDITDNMPAFIETTPINLNGANSSYKVNTGLNLPQGIQVVGEQVVTVEVGIAAIESSIQLVDIPIKAINLANGLKIELSPLKVDLYLSGPVYLLEQLTVENISVTVDLLDKTAGTYQLTPIVTLTNDDIRLDSILPGSIEVIISK